jgi:zinc D-Ala-D-Ala carboxypeptidase
MRLSLNIDRSELERDGAVIPTEVIVNAYVELCATLLEPIRSEFGEPIYITSGYRDAATNARIGGAKDSQHVATADHCAVDFYMEPYRQSMRPVFDWICLKSNLGFDQCILEHGKLGDVIHISWSRTPRRMALEGATFNQSAYEARYVAPLHVDEKYRTGGIAT